MYRCVESRRWRPLYLPVGNGLADVSGRPESRWTSTPTHKASIRDELQIGRVCAPYAIGVYPNSATRREAVRRPRAAKVSVE